MASEAYEQILQVQANDLHLTQLRHKLDTHPLRAEIEQGGAVLADLERERGGLDERKHELDRELKRYADEVELIEAKRAEVDSKLYDGTVTSPKELEALQAEANSQLERQRGIEDSELELMEQLETLEGELDVVDTKVTEATTGRDTATAALAEASAEIEAEIATVEAERVTVAAAAPAQLLTRYQELAGQFGGVAVARFVDGRCDGCHIQMSAVAIDQLGKAPDDAVVTCEECGRLLVR